MFLRKTENGSFPWSVNHKQQLTFAVSANVPICEKETEIRLVLSVSQQLSHRFMAFLVLFAGEERTDEEGAGV